MSNPVLEVKNLTFGYGRPLCQPVSAAFSEGELVAVAGRNGCGKSTMLYSILGLRKPISGHVDLLGEEIYSLKAENRARKIAAVLTQRFNSAGLSMFDVAALGRQPYTTGMGRLSDDDREVVKNALLQMGIDQLSEKRMDEVSDGERQKCMIARALTQDTRVIVMDEPLAFLDFPTKLEVLKLLRQLTDKGKTILFSTHELNLIADVVDGTLIFNENQVNLVKGDPNVLRATLESTFGTLTGK